MRDLLWGRDEGRRIGGWAFVGSDGKKNVADQGVEEADLSSCCPHFGDRVVYSLGLGSLLMDAA